MRRFLFWILGLLGIVGAAVLLALAFPPTGWVSQRAERFVAERTGYVLDIDDLDLDLLSLKPSATFSMVTLDGEELPGLLDAGRAEVAIDLVAAIGGELVLDRVLIENARAELLRTDDGRTSWTAATAGTVEQAAEDVAAEAIEPDGGEIVLPTIRELRVDDLALRWKDDVTETDANLEVQAEGSTLPGATPLIVMAEGVGNEAPVQAELRLDSPLEEVLSGEPKRFALQIATDGLDLGLAGSIGELATLVGTDLQLDLDLDSLDSLESALGRALPALAPASLVATIRTEGNDVFARVSGTTAGEPVSARLVLEPGSPITAFLSSDSPVVVDLDATVGDARLGLSGSVGDPATLGEVDLALDAEVESFSAIETLLGVELPDLDPATLTATLLTDGSDYVVRRFDLVAADSVMEGDLRVDPGTEPPTVYANVIARQLDVDVLLDAFAVGDAEKAGDDDTAGSDAAREPAGGRVLPSDSLPVELLFGQAQGAVALRVDELHYKAIPLDSLDARVEFSPGSAIVSIDEMTLADGEVSGALELEPSGDGTSLDAELDLELRRVRIGRFAPDADMLDDLGGPLGGRVELWASGDSVAALAASLDGGVLLLMGEGKLDQALVEIAGLDLFQTIGDLLDTGEDEFRIRCAYASLHAESGMVSVDDLVVDSTDTVFLAEGRIDLGAETVELRVEPHPKDPSLLSASTTATVGGTFADLQYGIDEGLPARAAAAAALALVATPAAALLPFIEVGGGEDSGFCRLEGALDGDAG